MIEIPETGLGIWICRHSKNWGIESLAQEPLGVCKGIDGLCRHEKIGILADKLPCDAQAYRIVKEKAHG